MFRKKGTKPRRPADQFQPDYVKKAKKEVKKNGAVSEEEKESIASYFKAHNNSVKDFGETNGS